MALEDLEETIARSTPAGRETLQMLHEARQRISDEQRFMKSFELTELTRQIMKPGIRHDHPQWSELEVNRHDVDRLLSYHGLSLEKIDRLRNQEVHSP